MSFTVNDAFSQQFRGTIMLVAQQQKARLSRCVLDDDMTGESMYFEQLAVTSARKVTTRHADSPMMNVNHLRRRIAPYDWDWGDIIDRLDKVKMLVDPTSPYTQAAAASLERGKDDEILAAFFGTAFVGHAGATTLTWPNGNSETTPAQPAGTQVAVNDWTYGNGSGNIGLTVSKLISASVALDAAEGDDDEERYIVIKAKHKGQLLATTELTSADYNTVRALYAGKIDTFAGFKFLHSERLLVNGSSQDRVPAWRRSGMGLGIAKDISVNVAQRPDKRFAWYAYADMSIGAARLEESKIVEIICA